MNWAIVRLYSGASGKQGYYNMQELGMAKEIQAHGINVFVFIFEKGITDLVEEPYEKNISIIKLPYSGIANHGWFSCNLLRRYKIDLVQLLSDNQICAPHVMKYCKKNGIYCVNYVGALFSNTNSKGLKRYLLDFFAFRNIRYYKQYPVAVKTPFVKEQLEKFGVKDATLVPVGLDIEEIPVITETREELKFKWGFPSKSKVLLFVGRLENYKRPWMAIELLEKLAEDFELIMIGKGTLQSKLQESVEQKHLANRVHFIESVPNCEIHKYFKVADFFVNFNINEIFGMSILEAMYQGCIPVAFKAAGPNYIIEDGTSGFLVENIEQMKEIIEKPIAEDMRMRVRERIENEFMWASSVKIMMDMVEKWRILQ